MKTALQILTFERFIAPVLLQVLFWAGIGGTIYGTVLLIKLDHWAWWCALIFGVLFTRVLFESLMLAYRAFDRLGEIRDALADSRPGPVS
jgi:hypothetical protein